VRAPADRHKARLQSTVVVQQAGRQSSQARHWHEPRQRDAGFIAVAM